MTDLHKLGQLNVLLINMASELAEFSGACQHKLEQADTLLKELAKEDE